MRRHVLPAEPRLPDARRSPTSAVDICSIGVIAKSAAAATASALANAATRGVIPRSRRNGIPAMMSAGTRLLSS